MDASSYPENSLQHMWVTQLLSIETEKNVYIQRSEQLYLCWTDVVVLVLDEIRLRFSLSQVFFIPLQSANKDG